METVVDFLKNSVRRLPNKPALVFGSTRPSYARLETLSDASRLLANWGVGLGLFAARDPEAGLRMARQLLGQDRSRTLAVSSGNITVMRRHAE